MTRAHLLICALICAGCAAVAAATAPAHAKTGFEPRVRFAHGHGDNPTPIDGPFTITEPGTYDFTLQVGIFEAEGFTNYGTDLWYGELSASDGEFVGPGAWSLPEPFDTLSWTFPQFAPYGYLFFGPGRIIGVTPMRGIERDVPPGPEPYGADEYVSVYRLSLIIDDPTPRDIVLDALGRAHALSGWVVFDPDPDHDPSTPEALFAPVRALVGPGLPADASLTISVIPAPGSAALLALATLLARRRVAQASRC